MPQIIINRTAIETWLINYGFTYRAHTDSWVQFHLTVEIDGSQWAINGLPTNERMTGKGLSNLIRVLKYFE